MTNYFRFYYIFAEYVVHKKVALVWFAKQISATFFIFKQFCQKSQDDFNNNNVIPNFKVTPIVGIKVEMTNDNNQKVKNFSGQIEIKAEIPATAKKTKTGKTLQEGDVVLITSFDEDTKVYKYEGSSVLVKNTNGKLEAKASVNHLTDFFISDSNSLTIQGVNPTRQQIESANNIFGLQISASDFQNSPLTNVFYLVFEGSVELFKSNEKCLKVAVQPFKEYDTKFYSISSVKISPAGSIKGYNSIDALDYSYKLPTEYSQAGQLGPAGPYRVFVYDLYDNLLAVSGESPFPSVNTGSVVEESYIVMKLPPPPNHVQIITDLKCDGNKANTIQHVIVFAKPSGSSAKSYFWLGDTDKDKDGIMQLSTLQLKRGGKFDFRFEIGGISFYYDNQTITNGPIHKVTSTLPDTFCK